MLSTMTKIGVIKQTYGEYTTISAIVEDIPEAEHMAMELWKNGVTHNCHYFVRTVSNNAVIGDCV